MKMNILYRKVITVVGWPVLDSGCHKYAKVTSLNLQTNYHAAQ